MKKPSTTQDLDELKQKKISTYYKVKETFQTVTKDVDFAKRTVQVVPNTFYWFDSDCDVLIKGSTTKSIADRGPSSNSPAKIKNVYAHDLKTQVGKPILMDERVVDNLNVQYAESEILKTTKGNDTLIEYQEGVIDNHSIGFQYTSKGLTLVTADDDEWSKWLAQLINPKDAEEYGFMFIVSDIKQFEWSPVAFGANELTPYLGVKSTSKDALALKVNERLDLLEKQLRHGKQSDETMYNYSLETLQLKQIINELFTKEPSIKDTLLQSRQNKQDTRRSMNVQMVSCKNCNTEFDINTMPLSGNGYVRCPVCDTSVSLQDTTSDLSKAFDFSKAIKETTFIKI